MLIAAASMGALFAVAACGGGGDEGSPQASGTAAGADFTKQGDIEFWRGKDSAGYLPKAIKAFNDQHPNGKVTFHELPEAADQQRQQMIQNTQIKNPKMAVLGVDVVWTAEFAANGYVEALPADQFPTDQMLKPAVDSATYFDKLYGYPQSTNAGLLFYRKDLLDKYNLKPPTTFDELRQACDKIKPGENNPKLECYSGQFQKYEGLVVNTDEAIHGAGGVIVGDDGKPNVATPEATKGLQTLVDLLKDGYAPKAAITWKEEEGRQAFQQGNLIFLRNWPGIYAQLAAEDGSSKVPGKFAVALLPGITGPGVSSLGGANLAVAKNAENKGTAVDFIKFMAAPEQQKGFAMATGGAPTLASAYTDPDILKKYPSFPTLLKSLESAKPRPKAVKYGDVTVAIQDAAYGALQGQTAPDAALQSLQSKLQTLIK